MEVQMPYLFFVKRSEASSREALSLETGAEILYNRDRRRLYFSSFGKIALMRPYFYQNKLHNHPAIIDWSALITTLTAVGRHPPVDDRVYPSLDEGKKAAEVYLAEISLGLPAL